MLIKCPLETYAWYDEWGNRYLVFSRNDLGAIWRIVRCAALTALLMAR